MPNSSRTDTGDGEPYTDADEAAIEAALEAAEAEYASQYGEEPDGFGEGSPVPFFLNVRAQVEWGGSVQHSNDGKRTVHLDLGSDRIERLGPHIAAAREARARAASASPATSYQAKGWRAQLNALVKSTRGSDLADRAGLNPSARTVSAWLSEERAPSAANQAKIADAYAGLATWRVDNAQQRSREANHRLTEALTDQCRDRYGATVRFRDIEGMSFDD
jgi:hypothetical protein